MPPKSFVQVGRARTTRSPESNVGSREKSRVFSGTCSTLSGYYDPESSSLRTSQQSVLPGLTDAYRRLPRSGLMTSNGLIYELRISERPTAERGYSSSESLPTPTATMNMACPSMADRSQGHRNFWMLPTPLASDSRITGHAPNGHKQLASHLVENAPDMFQTLGENGRMSPRFVAWMMGAPPCWTELNDSTPSETLSYRNAPSGLAEKSCNQEFSVELFNFYKAGFLEAKAHVWRQQHAGKHEQDKIDAIEWLKKYTEEK